jgi:hypothetical protein
MDYLFPITAINRGGETRIFYDAEALWAFIRDRNNGNVGGYWTESYGWRFNDRPRALIKVCDNADSRFWTDIYRNDWILRDDRGRAVDKERIPAPPFQSKSKWLARWNQRYGGKDRAAELGLPIPGTGHCRRYKA